MLDAGAVDVEVGAAVVGRVVDVGTVLLMEW